MSHRVTCILCPGPSLAGTIEHCDIADATILIAVNDAARIVASDIVVVLDDDEAMVADYIPPYEAVITYRSTHEAHRHRRSGAYARLWRHTDVEYAQPNTRWSYAAAMDVAIRITGEGGIIRVYGCDQSGGKYFHDKYDGADKTVNGSDRWDRECQDMLPYYQRAHSMGIRVRMYGRKPDARLPDRVILDGDARSAACDP